MSNMQPPKPVFVPKLEKDQVLKLKDESSITVKECKEILGSVTNRVNYIWRKILEIQNRKLDWWDFDNEGGDEDSPGSFDIRYYSESVDLTGHYSDDKSELYDDGFPTNFLWEDFEELVANETKNALEEIERKKIQAKDKAALLKQKKAEMRKLIESKLTQEELKFVTFK